MRCLLRKWAPVGKPLEIPRGNNLFTYHSRDVYQDCSTASGQWGGVYLPLQGCLSELLYGFLQGNGEAYLPLQGCLSELLYGLKAIWRRAYHSRDVYQNCSTASGQWGGVHTTLVGMFYQNCSTASGQWGGVHTTQGMIIRTALRPQARRWRES